MTFKTETEAFEYWEKTRFNAEKRYLPEEIKEILFKDWAKINEYIWSNGPNLNLQD